MSRYRIICLEGELSGNEIVLAENEKVLVGREAKQANLVFRDRTISRLHCGIEAYRNGQYRITNYSATAIIVENNREIMPNETVIVPAGSVVVIGRAGTKLQLK